MSYRGRRYDKEPSRKDSGLGSSTQSIAFEKDLSFSMTFPERSVEIDSDDFTNIPRSSSQESRRATKYGSVVIPTDVVKGFRHGAISLQFPRQPEIEFRPPEGMHVCFRAPRESDTEETMKLLEENFKSDNINYIADVIKRGDVSVVPFGTPPSYSIPGSYNSAYDARAKMLEAQKFILSSPSNKRRNSKPDIVPMGSAQSDPEMSGRSLKSTNSIEKLF